MTDGSTVQGTELTREREYVAALYTRLDELIAQTREALDIVRIESVGGNHQSRSERDAYARLYEDRLRSLTGADDRLAFGRLTLADGDSEHRYIGRIGLRDEEQDTLLLDWRAPQSAAFYQATAARPMGTRARRHLTTRGREVLRFEDEVFDEELLRQGTVLQGEGALMAALDAQRTGRMHDIVATIQSEQDRIIRSELRGVLVVQGGPGTGKTAVALHRAAYLLYSYRDRIASSGVLVVGPSRSFLRYIEAVLPSLGETGVVLSTVGQLYPGLDLIDEDAPTVARVKGSARMAELLKRAVRSRQVVPAEAQLLDVNGEKLRLEPQDVERAITRARDSRKPHNEARVTFVKTLLSQLTRQLADQLRSHGSTVDEADEAVLREDVRTAYDVRVALNTAWIPLTPEKLLQDLYARPNWFATLTPRWSAEQRSLLRRDRDAPFTVSDVPLLDEAAELLGAYDDHADASKKAEKEQRRRDLENAEAAIRNMGVDGLVNAKDLAAGFAERSVLGTTAERAAADRTWTYGHVVVDEAQELSPMQWRVLLRRCPMRSFTIVGDVAQASGASAASTWDAALRDTFGRQGRGVEAAPWRLEELTVNYRTPAQIVAFAERTARENGLEITPGEAVRSTEWPVRTIRDRGDAKLAARVLAAVIEDRAIGEEGTLAVIAPDDDLAAIAERLEERFGREVGRGATGLDRAIAVLSTNDAKGLEFDSVIIARPRLIAQTGERGAASLYVAMTRPTQRLTLVE
ncbi:AAA family ATPase [Rathayibacter rathayi]|uniref:AAA family ATPase n=1 Tax=Rathayibacter rathayi TaxID=33887 RepID=A0ABD6W9N3_RATRA|nr:UvrD-helicase domain-containing protein [Rathayibacter rathayi]AZZ48467.1 AAA family ATPase [Rathayibacter rathayi]MWV74382.1 AAA family ATPase [Rathayibacter rathayi NCPPB 2980 = VKM Ac-1601]PPF14842.1 AAA family ATPase [Rathayibacter rathayi]PPF50081.1 AAA family ATPase [Rathayibacter rathayi]PPG70070.1 AAA family ATPase [Rathayibacter rathayi]